MQAVPSIYEPDQTVIVLATVDKGTHIVQTEQLYRDDEVPMKMHVAYTKCEKNFYLGNLKTAQFITEEMGITEQLQPVNGVDGTVAVGFNPTTQQWFGWSHRAIASFEIGTQVAKGDCAFKAANRDDFAAEYLAFWDHGKTHDFKHPTTGETVSYDITGVVAHDVVDSVAEDLLNPRVGITVTTTCTYSDGRKPLVSEHFKPYPAIWGRGTWTAETLEDAKEMARIFAESVG